MQNNQPYWKERITQKDPFIIIKQDLKSEPFEIQKIEIQGVPVYIKHLAETPCIHLRIGFSYGARHDEIGKEGTAHFLEHMLFDGSSMFKDEHDTQEFGKVVMLDSLNAYTNPNELFMTGKCLPYNFPIVIEAIMSMLFYPTLSEKSFEHEKKVIIQEAWGRYLNETHLTYLKEIRDTIFHDMPDRLRICTALGWPHTIEALTLGDIKKAHETYIGLSNMEIYIAGNIESIGGIKHIEELISKHLADKPKGTKSPLPYIPSTFALPKKLEINRTFEEIGLSPREQASIELTTYHSRIEKVAGNPNTPEEYHHLGALFLTGELLSELAFRKLRLDNSWCYGAGANAIIKNDYLGIEIGGKIDHHHIDEAIKIVWQIIEDIKSGIYKDDFEKTKITSIESALSRELLAGTIIDRAVDQIRIHGTISTLESALHEIAHITYEDIINLISTYFTREKVFTEIIRPSDMTSPAENNISQAK